MAMLLFILLLVPYARYALPPARFALVYVAATFAPSHADAAVDAYAATLTPLCRRRRLRFQRGVILRAMPDTEYFSPLRRCLLPPMLTLTTLLYAALPPSHLIDAAAAMLAAAIRAITPCCCQAIAIYYAAYDTISMSGDMQCGCKRRSAER